MKRITRYSFAMILAAFMTVLITGFISCSTTSTSTLLTARALANASFSSYNTVSASLFGLMTFDDNGQSVTSPSEFAIPPVPISWMGGIFNGTLEETTSGEDDTYQVHGSLSSDGAWIESMFFSAEKIFSAENSADFFRITLQNVPLARALDKNGNIESVCNQGGADVQRSVSKIEYATGPLGGTQIPPILSNSNYISTDWSNQGYVPNLTVTLAVEPKPQTTGGATSTSTIMGSGGASSAMALISIYNERISIVLGFLTLFALMAVFFSCRTCVSVPKRLKLVNLMNSRAYRKFYQYHSYYWWVFEVLLVAHFMMVVMHVGMQRAGDTDPLIYWFILLLGLSTALATAALLFSCRIMPRLITAATAKKPLTYRSFNTFFQRHGYYWWLVLLLALAHFTVGYVHIGIWPK